MTIDVAAFVGTYPYRELDGTTAADILRGMDRVGIDRAWVGYLPSFLHADPGPGNERLNTEVRAAPDRLTAIPTVAPDLPEWEADLRLALERNAPAVRVYPMHLGIDPAGSEMCGLARATAEAGLALVLTVRFEDGRQRVPADRTPDLPPAAVRALVRVHERVRILVTHAGREFVEEVHYGSTEQEAVRLCWDIGWLWGPPAEDFPELVRRVGSDRFVFGTGQPLRIPEAALARLDLAEFDDDVRRAIEAGNLERWLSG